uniref:Tumor protein p63 regulated 1 n=1 Tax=Amphiprion ocellaris TaxID=80972 RepID=A0AAQ5YGJ7_AMPOC
MCLSEADRGTRSDRRLVDAISGGKQTPLNCPGSGQPRGLSHPRTNVVSCYWVDMGGRALTLMRCVSRTSARHFSTWLVDHWNNEKERLVLITDNTLLVFKYDFMMFQCEQIQKISLNFIDRISYGTFSFPKRSLLQREGEGVRIFWDRLREPSFSSRWNPFATDFPFITFTYHPVRNISDTFAALCDIQNFREKLKDAAQKAHTMKPVPGKANGVLVLNQQIHIDAYVGAMSFLGNQNKLGYSMARGNIGF